MNLELRCAAAHPVRAFVGEAKRTVRNAVASAAFLSSIADHRGDGSVVQRMFKRGRWCGFRRGGAIDYD